MCIANNFPVDEKSVVALCGKLWREISDENASDNLEETVSCGPNFCLAPNWDELRFCLLIFALL